MQPMMTNRNLCIIIINNDNKKLSLLNDNLKDNFSSLYLKQRDAEIYLCSFMSKLMHYYV